MLLFQTGNEKNVEFCLDAWAVMVYTALTATQYAVPEKEKAPVAQLDRASDYGSEGLRFESSRACFQQGISENSGSVHSKPVFLFTVFLLESKKAWGRPGFD